MTTSPKTWTVMIAADDDGYVAHSDHARIGSARHTDLDTLRRTVRHAIENEPDHVRIIHAANLPTSATGDIEDDALLDASNPKPTYRTVPGTERLPASGDTEPRDGLTHQGDASPTDRYRSGGHVKIVAPGQVVV